MSIRNRLVFSLTWLLLCVGCASTSSPQPVEVPTPGGAESSDSKSQAAPATEPSTSDAEGESSQPAPVSESAPVGGAPQEASGPLPIPEGTKVLHIGDSFAGALGRPLGDLFEGAGMRSVLKHTDSSYLTDWAWDGNLQKFVWKYNPDLVIVTLGANELEIVDPAQREKTVKKIISLIGPRPCVWVAIPLWEGPKNGLLEVIRKHSAPCVYMDTNALIDTSKMERIHDGIHPTTEAREKWAAFVFDWLKTHRRPSGDKPWALQL